MMSLFSVFDPISFMNWEINWIIMFLVFMIFPIKFYMCSSGFQGIFNMFSKMMNKMFNEISFPNYMALSFVSFTSFIYIMMTNLLGLLPFVFTSTAHPKITLGLGLIFWLSFFMMGWFKNFKESAAHLVPEGSPLFLSPVMVLIESISHLMRPFTLSIRLAANMMAGHLIVGLLSSISLLNMFGFFSSLFLQSVLLVLEFGVSVIQGFVFSILLLLYALEYYH